MRQCFVQVENNSLFYARFSEWKIYHPALYFFVINGRQILQEANRLKDVYSEFPKDWPL